MHSSLKSQYNWRPSTILSMYVPLWGTYIVRLIHNGSSYSSVWNIFGSHWTLFLRSHEGLYFSFMSLPMEVSLYIISTSWTPEMKTPDKIRFLLIDLGVCTSIFLDHGYISYENISYSGMISWVRWCSERPTCSCVHQLLPIYYAPSFFFFLTNF